MKKTKDTNKGITLIALVITIIVMLILVAVTITMAVNGGLFGYASSAGTKTNAAKDAEQEFANLQPDMTVNDLIDKYTGWTEDDDNGGSALCGDCTDGWIWSSGIAGVGEREACPKCMMTFTVWGNTYTALKEMTWGEWTKSEEVNFSVNGEYIANRHV